ncbi:hypothetical protein COO60DRAFT_846175 [Scenedesmus sp. NREL 46B-D3]|nr:hypothetical protein COO60DRAFT_846175 [Scenedesmus sp. NREL 46B-D3]
MTRQAMMEYEQRRDAGLPLLPAGFLGSLTGEVQDARSDDFDADESNVEDSDADNSNADDPGAAAGPVRILSPLPAAARGIETFQPWRAATILVTTPIASLPPSAADPAVTCAQAVHAVKAAGVKVRVDPQQQGEQEDEDEEEDADTDEEADADGVWWKNQQWYTYLEAPVPFTVSWEEMTDGKPMSKVAVKALAWHLRAKCWLATSAPSCGACTCTTESTGAAASLAHFHLTWQH